MLVVMMVVDNNTKIKNVSEELKVIIEELSMREETILIVGNFNARVSK